MNLPIEFQKNMQSLLKTDYEKFIESFNESPKRGFRININFISVKDFNAIFPYEYKLLNEKQGLCELLSEEKIGNSIYHHLGLLYLQEPSSMLSSVALSVKEGETVLDLCSAPGGKGSQILDNNKTGFVVLNEINRARANILLSNVERQGFKNAIITSLSPEMLSKKFVNFFDKILVDAPCSGEGMFRKDSQTILEWNAGLPEFNHSRQMEILSSADKMIKEGGEIVYSTCTFNLEENEKTISEFAKNFGYEIVALPEFIVNNTSQGFSLEDNKNTCLARRCFFHNGFGEGQFIAKLVKKSENLNDFYSKKQKNSQSKNEMKVIEEFIKENLTKTDFKYYSLGNNIYVYNNDFDLNTEGVVCLGVNLGQIQNNRLNVHHQFFKAYGEYFKNKINLTFDDARVNKYLRGEEIEVNENIKGYACVLVNNVPLGGGKASQGRLKNHYPKGLRNN